MCVCVFLPALFLRWLHPEIGAASEVQPAEPHSCLASRRRDKQKKKVIKHLVIVFSLQVRGLELSPSNLSFPFSGLAFLNTPKLRFYEQTKLYIKHFYIPKLTK